MMMEPEINLNEPWPQDKSMRERTMTLLLSLFLILLAFFVQMNAFSTKNSSRADSTLSSVKEVFGKSTYTAGEGVMASPMGVMIGDPPYLQAVISVTPGRDTMGASESAQSDGVLTVRLMPDRFYVAKTGVMHPDGVAYTQTLAEIMKAGSAGKPLRSLEIRFILPADQLKDVETRHKSDAVPIRQAAAFALALTKAGVNSNAISVSLAGGDGPAMELRFYSISSIPQTAGAND